MGTMSTQDQANHRPDKRSNVVKVLHWGSDIPHIVTLIGAPRFQSNFLSIAKAFSLEGQMVLTPHVYTTGDETLKRSQIDELHQLALKRIDMADVVFVVNPHNILSPEVRKEIEYAQSLGRTVRYMETPASI